MTAKKVVILLPTLNEENGIGRLIDEIRTFSKEWQIIVVDSRSTDRTVDIAKSKGVKVLGIRERGKGIAIQRAFEGIEADYLIIMDADITYPPESISVLLDSLEKCDVVVGSRFKGNIEDGSMGMVNRLGNHGLTMLGNLLYGKVVSDMCSGMWGFRRKAYKNIRISAQRFEVEANFFIESVKHGFKICETPISYRKREGEAKLRITDGLAIGYFLMKCRF